MNTAWWPLRDLNPQPLRCKRSALAIELSGQQARYATGYVCLTKSEPFLNGTDGARSAAESIGKISESLIVVGCLGIEPSTSFLSGKCSTDKLAALYVISQAGHANQQKNAL